MDIRAELDPLLKQLSIEKSLDVAEKITVTLSSFLGINVLDRHLLNISRVDAELSRFELAPGFARQAAAYEIPNNQSDIFDLKLFWIKKANKTNLSWIVGLTPNFEDSEANDYKNIGIDFVTSESCDSLIILLSNKYKIRSLELKDHVTHTQLEIFASWIELSKKQLTDSKKLLHSKLWESFNFEPINRKFYLELVESFSLLAHHLEKEFERKPSVMFTTRLIGRLLFVWFLKKKNLINNKFDYFSIDDSFNQKKFYTEKLEVLFFETLNQEKSSRNHQDSFTPYLNGGLFDINKTDFFSDPKLSFPNGYFNQLFNTLNKYNFTVDESSPEFQHVAIDPEMLGRIFESLLAEQLDEDFDDNKKKVTGAFYTPREIVSYMCEQSLIEYLKSKVPDSLDRDKRIEELIKLPETLFRDQDQNKRRDWKPYKDSIISALSGLDDTSALRILDPAVGSGAFPMGMLQLLVKVYSRLDVKYEADISKLKREILAHSLYGVDIEQTAIEICRLRAWLSVIVDIHEHDDIDPLPNLDFKFACANTLIPLDDQKQASLLDDHQLKDKLMTLRDSYFITSNKAKKEKLQSEYQKLTHQDELFDSKRTKQLKNYQPFDVSSCSEFYDPEVIHGVSKFDIIVGNPPYVSVKKITVQDKKTFGEIYFAGKGRFNLFTLFLERGHTLLKKSGILIFILPEGLFSNTEYRHAREYLVKNSTILLGCLFSKRVFEAAVDTAVIMIKNSKESRAVEIFKDLNTGVSNFTQNELNEAPNYLFPFMVNKESKSIISKINTATKYRLVDYLEVQQGIIYSGQDKSEVFANEKLTDSYKKVLDGRDILKYQINWLNKEDNKFINYTNKLHRPRNERIFLAPEKIVLPRRSTKLMCSVDRDQYYALNTAYIVLPKKDGINLLYVTALLNSKLIGFYYSSLYFGWQITIPALNSIPIFLGNQELEAKVSELVDKIHYLKLQNHEAKIAGIESEIDQLIYKIYGLNGNEIEIIENSFKS